MSYRELAALSLGERKDRWKALNKGRAEHEFVTLLRPDQLPKQIRKEFPPAMKPPVKGVLWCCYCGDWMPFESFSYTGYTLCTGCGISTKDFHNAKANRITD